MQFEHVTCPHCGLLCDDLSVKVSGLSLQLLSSKHAHCKKAFADASIESELPVPLVDGKPVTLEQAVTKSADILRSSSQPLVNGLIADVQTCRDALALTEKIGGVIDHANGNKIRCGVAVMQRHGEVRTTLAEVRNRADCVVIFGGKLLERFPRFMERVLFPSKSLGTEAANKKKIFILELANDGSFSSNEEENNITRLYLDFPLLESLVYRLQEVITHSEYISEFDESSQALMDLHQTIVSSHYTTFVWSVADFNIESAEHTVQALTETIKVLMSKVRCVGLPLSGSKGEITANHVATWQTGVPLPIAFMDGVPKHNPIRYNGNTMLQNKEADSLVWIASYSSEDTPPTTDIPTIVLGHPKMQCQQTAVFIPIGVPGIDHRGLACRTDSVATLPLQMLRNSKLLPANKVVQKIIQAL